MAVQQETSARKLLRQLGPMLEVPLDGVNKEVVPGRPYAGAPEIDGIVRLEDPAGLSPGDMMTAQIEHADGYDSWARPLPAAWTFIVASASPRPYLARHLRRHRGRPTATGERPCEDRRA